MSYDILVFDPAAAPEGQDAFLQWYTQELESDAVDNNPETTSPALQNWFHDIRKTFPAMNGPLAPSSEKFDHLDRDAELHLSEYTIGQGAIYANFSWSLAESAREAARTLAQKHGVGFFDASGNRELIRPVGQVPGGHLFTLSLDTGATETVADWSRIAWAVDRLPHDEGSFLVLDVEPAVQGIVYVQAAWNAEKKRGLFARKAPTAGKYQIEVQTKLPGSARTQYRLMTESQQTVLDTFAEFFAGRCITGLAEWEDVTDEIL